MSQFKIIELDSVDSTQTYVKEHPQDFTADFTTVITKEQTAGRGRGQNSWQMQAGLDLALSTVFKPRSSEAGAIIPATVICGYAVWQTLAPFKDGFHLKWPNDVYFETKKVAGILCEYHNGQVIIGIGTNVNSSDFGELNNRANSLKQITAEEKSINDLANHLLFHLKSQLQSQTIPLSDEFCKAYWQASHLEGAFLEDETGKSIRAVGLNPDGSLKVKYADGALADISSSVEVRSFSQ